ARAPERLAVRRLAARTQHLVRVLVRHLVLEHLDDHAPRVAEDQRPADLDRAVVGGPLPEAALRVGEHDRGRDERAAQVVPVDGLELAPEGADGGGEEIGTEAARLAERWHRPYSC